MSGPYIYFMDERVLLVEDDASIRETTALGLEAAGIRVALAWSAGLLASGTTVWNTPWNTEAAGSGRKLHPPQPAKLSICRNSRLTAGDGNPPGAPYKQEVAGSSPAPPISVFVTMRKPAFFHGLGVSGMPGMLTWCCPRCCPRNSR